MSNVTQMDVAVAAASVDQAWVNTAARMNAPARWVPAGNAALKHAVGIAVLMRVVPAPFRRYVWHLAGRILIRQLRRFGI